MKMYYGVTNLGFFLYYSHNVVSGGFFSVVYNGIWVNINLDKTTRLLSQVILDSIVSQCSMLVLCLRGFATYLQWRRENCFSLCLLLSL